MEAVNESNLIRNISLPLINYTDDEIRIMLRSARNEAGVYMRLSSEAESAVKQKQWNKEFRKWTKFVRRLEADMKRRRLTS
jgi:hypothetical protein